MPSNRLANEKSPYLLQHAENPVSWYPWGDEALGRAREQDKPIFLSVGYSTCHWCHVMERESFEDPAIAGRLNELFINIKLDREERPDLDRVYMTFVQATTGGGGWPMSVWLTPQLEPFFGGTYFPPVSAHGRPSFGTVIEELGRAWRERRAEVRAASTKITAQLRRALDEPMPDQPIDPLVLQRAYATFEADFDGDHGGFGGAPKFPRPVVHDLLMRHYLRTGDERAVQMVLETLRAMARGGIHDHLEGGFHRYSVDGRWHVPHFEKMLYDQALLATSYLEALMASGEALMGETARDILDYVLARMTDVETGGFYSAEDADSLTADGNDKREGAFYVWRAEEIEQALGADAALFAHHYGVSPEGNADDPHGELTGTNVLHQRCSLAETAERFELGVEEAAGRLAAARQQLEQLRDQRARPGLDDKILTSWNGLMISALVKGALVLEEPRYLKAAERAGRFLLERLYDDEAGRLYRRYRAAEVAFEATLEDYGAACSALVELYQARGDVTWLEAAEMLADLAIKRFEDEESGGFFATSGEDPTVLLRLKDDYDGAEPSGNATLIHALIRLAPLVGRPDLEATARKALRSFSRRLANAPHALPRLLVSFHLTQSPPPELVISGVDQPSGNVVALLRPIFDQLVADPVVIWATSEYVARYGERAGHIRAVFDQRPAVPMVQLCHDQQCELPTSRAQVLRALLLERRHARVGSEIGCQRLDKNEERATLRKFVGRSAKEV